MTQARDFAAISATEVGECPAAWVSAFEVDARRAGGDAGDTFASPDVLLLDRVADSGLLLFQKAAGTHEQRGGPGGPSRRGIDGILWWRWNPVDGNGTGSVAAPYCVIVVLTRAAAGLDLAYLLVPVRPGITIGTGHADAVALLASLAACSCAGRDAA